jgi:hypothetical protein
MVLRHRVAGVADEPHGRSNAEQPDRDAGEQGEVFVVPPVLFFRGGDRRRVFLATASP